jgi:hypothetical protein
MQRGNARLTAQIAIPSKHPAGAYWLETLGIGAMITIISTVHSARRLSQDRRLGVEFSLPRKPRL